MQNTQLVDILTNVAHQYPKDLVAETLACLPRMAFNIELAIAAARPKAVQSLSICDIGGGLGSFSIGCKLLGARKSMVIDDFRDPINTQLGASPLDLHRTLGVDVVSRDAVRDGIEDLEGPIDVVTSFDSMEHWHNSPKKLFAQVADKLRPGGAFVLSVPNCVNLRKRLTVPLGRGSWSQLEDWYEAPVFRGHVREPSREDLLYIARDMGLTNVKIIGRNWSAYHSGQPVVRALARLIDRPLQLRPSLCSDLYLIGHMP